MYRLGTLAVFSFLGLGVALGAGSPTPATDGLRINPQNPHYFIYKGRPFFIIGSGMESHCQPWSRTAEQWRAYLDMLRRNGFNRVRFFPWDFCWAEKLEPTFSPWRVLDAQNFRYDLTRFNPAYWDLVRRIIQMARERDIVVEYNLFDYCSLQDSPKKKVWSHNPLSARAGGAVPGNRGKPGVYAFADYSDLDLFKQPFDPHWPWQKRNQWLQQFYVKHTVDQLGGYENIYWEIMNEQGWGKVEPQGVKWTRHWLAFLDKYDPHRRLRSINAADVYDEMEGMDIVCEHPIPFFNRKKLTRPEVIVEIVHEARKFGKPVICDETGFFPPQSSTEDQPWRTITPEQLANERRAFWYAFVAGGHWTAVCWQDFQERPTHRWIRHLADFVQRVPYWTMAPHDDLVQGPFAHCLARPGKLYVVYLGRGGQVSVDLGGRKLTAFEARWLDPRTGKERAASGKQQGNLVVFQAPDKEDWVLVIRAGEH